MDWNPVFLILFLTLFHTTSQIEDGRSKVPWITVSSNRFCCDIKTAPSNSKYTDDNENLGLLNALDKDKRDKLDIYNYRAHECQIKTSCASNPPVMVYSGDCRDGTKPTVVPTPSDDEMERCRIYNASVPNVEEILPERRVKNVYSDTDCVFHVDFTLSVDLDKGFKVFTTYATEKSQQTVKDDLAEPKTKDYFSETTIGETKDIFGFPYFLIIRTYCESGGYYGDESYRFPINGNTLSTSISLMYKAYTSRQAFQNSLQVNFEAAFVNLEQDKDNNLVPNPDRPRQKDPDTDQDLCPLNVCFPGFLIPFPFLKVPISQILIREHRAIQQLQKMIYANPFHKREASGHPPLEIAEEFSRYNLELDPKERKFIDSSLISPRYFFPRDRHGNWDTDLEGFTLDSVPQVEPKVCVVPEQFQLQGETGIPASFFLKGKEDKRIYAMDEMDIYRSHLPLTQDDFLQPQYTLGTAPVVAIAGFFRPDLMMFGNPEMERIELIKWHYNQDYDQSASGEATKPEFKRIFFPNPNYEATKADVIPECLSRDPKLIKLPTAAHYDPSTRPTAADIPEYKKPLYASVEETCYGRRQYYPMDYSSPNTHAIFEIISMEDRLLLRTANGLVSLYGFGDVATTHDIVLHAKQNETLYRCFKFVRIVKRALMDFDPILAVTYSYTESSGTERDQEVHYGTLTKAGTPIKWVEVGASEFDDSKDRSPHHISPAIANTGTTDDIPEAHKICNIVYKERILPIFDSATVSSTVDFDPKRKNEFKCLILDGSPVPTRPNSIQLLVEMSFNFFKEKTCAEPPPPRSTAPNCSPLEPAKCMRYLYCNKLFPAATAAFNPAVDRDADFLERVTNQSCVKNPEGVLRGLYDGDTKDYKKIITLQKIDYLMTSKEDEKDCDAFRAGPTAPSPEDKDWAWVNSPNLTKPVAKDFCNFDIQKLTLYIIAEHEMGKIVHRGNTWDIVGVYPQRPCRVSHYEAIRIVLGFDDSYFGFRDQVTGLKTSVKGEFKTCYESEQANMKDDLQITRFTYTRQINLNAFFYGNVLLHSVDGGKSISFLRGFPQPAVPSGLDYDLIQLNNQHVIKLMAFNDDGQYAFLTSKRELWLGNSGSAQLVRIRPSNGYSMMNLEIYKNRPGIAQAVPFSILFDTFNKLYELAVVRDAENHAQEIVKRPINVELILRNEYFVESLHNAVNKVMVEKKDSVIYNTPPKFVSTGTDVTLEFDHYGMQITAIFAPPGASCEQSFGCIRVKYAIEKLTLHCPYSQMSANQNYTKTMNRLQQFVFLAPQQHPKLGMDYKFGALKSYQAAAFSLIHDSFFTSESGEDDFYSHVPRDPFVKWRTEKQEQTHIGLLNYLRGDPKKTGVLVDPRAAIRNTDPEDSAKNKFVSFYYLNYNQTVELVIQFYIKNAQLLSKTDFQKQKLSEIQLNIDNGNGRLIQLETERVKVSKYASVKFIVFIKLIRNTTLLKQHGPGQGLIPVPLTFHLIGAFGRCFDIKHWGTVGESITTTVFAGCPPAADILFNWNATLHSLIFKQQDEKYGDSNSCHKREFVCFFAREAIIFHFDVLDMAKQRYVPFTGIYKFKVIGGGRAKNEITDYTPEEIEAYNIPGKSDVSLIWNLALVQEDEIQVQKFEDIGKDSRTQEVLLRAGASRIKWVCNTLSPCSRIAPRGLLFKTIYFFRVEITNENVDDGTLCKHKLTFVIMLYGFPPSPEMLLLTTLVFCILLLVLMYVMFVCCRRNKKVWRANKLKISGWVKIIIDTFPKPMKKKANAVDEQTRKDAILLSLQGHLKVPDVILRKREGSPVSDEDHSAHSSGSSMTTQNLSEVLPDVKSRKAAATWTDMVYEQIISRRLLSIVERNKRIREEIMKKALESNIMDELPNSNVTTAKPSSTSVAPKPSKSAKDKPNKDKEQLEKKKVKISLPPPPTPPASRKDDKDKEKSKKK